MLSVQKLCPGTDRNVEMSIGKVSAFDMKTGVWSSYIDRLEMYFTANDVLDDLKLPTLIAVMGDEPYELLVNLASPSKPSTLSYEHAVNLLRQHLQPEPSSLAERYRFRQRRQGQEENIATYIAELKKLSRFCKFETSLNDNLRDQFVCGLRSDIIRQRLFAEDTISYAEAVKLATSLEAAERDAAAVEAPHSEGTAGAAGGIHALNLAGTGRSGSRGGRGSGGRGARAGSMTARDVGMRSGTSGNTYNKKNICSACGAYNHAQETCRFRNYECSKCQQVGHLRRVCPNWGAPGALRGGDRHRATGAAGPARGRLHFGKAEQQSDEDIGGDIEEELHHLCLNDYKPVSVSIEIDNRIISMEIDTGTAISCISKCMYDQYFNYLPIEKHNTIFKFYNGTKIKPVGIIKPTVRYNGQSKCLELFVIEGGTTSLLGRQWLGELGIIIPKFNCDLLNQVSCEHTNTEVENLIHRYKELFSGGLGRYRGGKATLRVREGAVPVFHRARPMPYALRERVDAELDAMLRAGVIEPVDCSDWASPLVPINKPDGSLRICADYKATLNPSLLVDRYPLPKIEDVLVNLNGNRYYSKIDLSQAYNQIELDETKKYTVINTHRGLFQYNRLVYGLSSSVGIFQRIMINILSGIPNVQVFLDDVIIGGKTEREHIDALKLVFQRLLENGLKLKKSKCVFLAEEVTYLGYIISREGIKADKSKIEAITNMEQPRNVSELRSFLGTVNFFGRFIKNLSATLFPLYNLLRKGTDWVWCRECEQAFTEVKKMLTSANVLCHYDQGKPLIVTCDASARGLGAVLTQPGPRGERVVAYASRSLSDAEKNYSQIHREALAIIFSIKKYHQYLYGRRFVLRTDHKPLVSIFGPNTGIPSMTASRMQRWAIILSAYSYDIEYVNTKDNCADALSRLPDSRQKNSSVTVPEQTYLHFAQDALLLDYTEIKKQTITDPLLGRVLRYIRDGWPTECDIDGLKPYFNRRKELYEELGCIMWGHRVVIPEKCRVKVLNIIHEPHMGIIKSKAIARSYVWWGGIDEAVEATCRGCVVCASLADAPPQHAPRAWPWPASPWARLHLDFMGPIYGKTYLVVVDAKSKWIEVFPVPSTAAVTTISKLSELWGRFGIPKQVVSDNGPPFTSREFKDFLKLDGVEHIFTAPYHPASNGAAENAVKTIKRVVKKAYNENKDIDKTLNKFLLYYRNTEHCSTGESPAMLLMGRRLRTHLDLLKPDQMFKVQRCQQRQMDTKGGSDRSINVGEEVWYRQYLKGEKWQPGKVTGVLGNTDYKVTDDSGNVVHRHIDQLRRKSRSSLVCPTVDKDNILSKNNIPVSPSGTVRSQRSEGAEPPTSVSPARSMAEGEDCFVTPEKEMSSPKPHPPSLTDAARALPPQTRRVRQCRVVNPPTYKF